MPWKSLLRTTPGLLTIVGFLGSAAVGWAQLAPPSERPDGEPFDVSTSFEIEQQPAAGFAIRAGRLFDANTGTNLTNQLILVKGEVITAVGPADQVQIPAGARVIDLSQASVLPGFIDSHVHHSNRGSSNQSSLAFWGANLAQKNLWGGFTTVVDMGAPSYVSVSLRDAINQGWVIGPRMQVVGSRMNPRSMSPYTAPNVYVPFGHDPTQVDDWRQMQNVNSPWLARSVTREHSHYGADAIKIYSTEDHRGSEPYSGAFYPNGEMIAIPSLTLEEMTAIVDEAHDRGLITYCHAYGGEGLRRCLEAGVDVPMHVEVGVTKTAGLDDETIRLYKSKQTLYGKPRPVIQTLWDLIGGMERGDARATGGRATRFSLTEQSFKRLVSEGITQIHGSGVFVYGHGLMAFQFEWYVKWGMSNGEAIKVGTINAAEYLNYNWGERIGSIEEGKYADIIATPGDPLQDIKETENVQFVMKGGVIYRNELDAPAATTDR